MEKFLSKINRFLALLLVVFMTQLIFYQSGLISADFIKFFHDSHFKHLWIKITQYLWISIKVLFYLAVFVYCFIIQPNIIDNYIYVTYFCSCIFLSSFVKVLTGEIKPFMFSEIFLNHTFQSSTCHSSYGMPSNHQMLSICLYFLMKILIFEK